MPQFKITTSACGKELYRTGPYNQFSGDRYFIAITVGTLETEMDSPVKSIRFAGEHVYVEKSATDKRDGGATSYWDFKFTVAELVMGTVNNFSYRGKFYFETEKGTVYTFDNEGEDFVYDRQTACLLAGNMQQVLNF